MKTRLSAIIILLCTVVTFNVFRLPAESKYVIAVLDFKNATGDRSLDYLKIAVPELIATNLAQEKGVTILERDRVREILKEKGLIQAGVLKGDEKEIGKLLSAKQLVGGSVVRTGKNFRIDVRIFDVKDGKVIMAEKIRSGNVDELIDAADSVSSLIVKKMTGQNVVYREDVEASVTKREISDYLELEYTPQNKFYLYKSKEPFYFRAGFTSKKYESKKKRVPLNLSIVLDRSGSMGDAGKLEYAKRALKFIVRNLSSKDTLSIVTYDDSVNVLVPPARVTGRAALMKKIDAISTGGSTNLSGGLQEGYIQVKENLRPGQINRILLISDGLANVGITDPERINSIVKRRSKEGITVSTFGVGKYFNEKMMTLISEFGNANYYFIGSADKIPDIFSNELNGLLAVVAQNCSVTISGNEGTVVESAFGYRFDKKNNGITVKLGDIVSEEKKLALIKMYPSAKKKGKKIAANIRFRFDDAVGNGGRMIMKQPVEIKVTGKRELVLSGMNPVIIKDVEMFISSREMEKTMDRVDRGELEEARKDLDENIERVKDVLKKVRSREMKKQVLNLYEYRAKLESVAEAPGESAGDDLKMIQKESRSRQYKLRKRK